MTRRKADVSQNAISLPFIGYVAALRGQGGAVMDWRGWVYSIFTFSLFIVFVFIVVRYYGRDKKKNKETESPKYRMLDDDDDKKVK